MKQTAKLFVTLSPTLYETDYTTKEFNLTISSNTSWTLTKPDWCTLSASSGSGSATIKVTVADNGGSTTDREGDIICIVAGGANSICKVKQKGKLFITFSPTLYETDHTAKTFDLTVTSNTSWTLSATSWCSVGLASGTGNATVKVAIAENNTTIDRELLITGTTPGGLTATCRVKQKAKPFVTVSPTTFDADHTAKTFDLIITSNTNWTLAKPDWCTLNATSGSGNATVKVTVTENGTTIDREGDIIGIIAGGVNSICKVKQKGKPFVSVSPTLYETDHTAKTFDLTVTSNTSWTLSSINWCSVSAASGTGNATVKVTIAENGTTIDREFLIICTIPGGSTATCKVIQKGKLFVTLSPTMIDTDPAAKNLNLIVTSNTNWTLNEVDWCRVSPLSGSGNATVTLSLSKNTTANERRFEIKPAANGTNSCVVIQKGDPVVSFSPTSITFDPSAGSKDIIITANTPWTLTAPAWCTLSSNSGQGNATVKVSVSENGIDERSGNIIATYFGGLTTLCPVKQTAKPWYGGSINVKVFFRNNFNESVSVNGNYRVQLGTAEINFSCSKILPANSSDNKVEVGSWTISNRDLKALQSLNIGFSNWSASSLPSNPTTLISTQITGDLSGYFNSSSVSGNPAGKYSAANVTWKTGANVYGVATLEIVYGIGSPGEEW